MGESPASRGRDPAVRWLDERARALLVLLVAVAALLRALLIVFSPAPFGYVWDFYYEGVRHLADTGHLPTAEDCWQCYHPPVFYLLGWPAYAFGRWVGGDSGASDVNALRWLAGLGTVSSAVTTYYGYRLLRVFRCRGASLVTGFALLVTFPCLFISSYGAEADIVLTALLSAFLFYLTRDSRTPSSPAFALRLGMLAGAAAATKYSGLVALVTGCFSSGGESGNSTTARILPSGGAVSTWPVFPLKYFQNFPLRKPSCHGRRQDSVPPGPFSRNITQPSGGT